ncbi:MAG: flagellar basal body-associated FliL family protein [bacterium]|jgi:flagellar basal body-associated protein FliL
MADASEQQELQNERPRSKLPLIIGGFVLLAGLVLAVAFMIMAEDPSGDEVQLAEVKDPDPQFPFTPFTVNLAPPDDQYLYTANITLEVKPKGSYTERDIQEEIGLESEKTRTKKAQIEEIIYEVLQTKTRSDVNSEAGRNKIRLQIKNKLNSILKTGEVVNVYLTGLVT